MQSVAAHWRHQQTAVLAAAAVAETRGWEMSRAETTTQVAALAAHGMTVSLPSAGLSEALQQIGATMTAEWLQQAGAEGQAVIDAYRGK